LKSAIPLRHQRKKKGKKKKKRERRGRETKKGLERYDGTDKKRGIRDGGGGHASNFALIDARYGTSTMGGRRERKGRGVRILQNRRRSLPSSIRQRCYPINAKVGKGKKGGGKRRES